MVDLKALPYVKTAKLVFVSLLLAALWLGLFYATAAALTVGAYRDWLTPLILLVAALPMTALAAVVFGPKSYFLLSSVLSLASLPFFPRDLYALLGVALLFFGFWRAYHRAQFELHNNIKFAPSHIIRSVGSIVLLAFMLLLSFQVYDHVAMDIANDEAGFYARIANTVTKGVLPLVEKQIPGFEQDLTLDQFVVNGFAGSVPGLSDFSAEQRAAQIAEGRSELAKSLGIIVTGQEPLSQVVQLTVEAQIKEITDNFSRRGLPVSTLLPAVYALAIFSLLRILSVFVMRAG
ncbi:MAG: hypothetical protein M1275_01320, partial [Patescibacteria group bacterium]|nr:hypothetical protein [Patescibacteria group bacterium]